MQLVKIYDKVDKKSYVWIIEAQYGTNFYNLWTVVDCVSPLIKLLFIII